MATSTNRPSELSNLLSTYRLDPNVDVEPASPTLKSPTKKIALAIGLLIFGVILLSIGLDFYINARPNGETMCRCHATRATHANVRAMHRRYSSHGGRMLGVHSRVVLQHYRLQGLARVQRIFTHVHTRSITLWGDCSQLAVLRGIFHLFFKILDASFTNLPSHLISRTQPLLLRICTLSRA